MRVFFAPRHCPGLLPSHTADAPPRDPSDREGGAGRLRLPRRSAGGALRGSDGRGLDAVKKMKYSKKRKKKPQKSKTQSIKVPVHPPCCGCDAEETIDVVVYRMPYSQGNGNIYLRLKN